MKPPKKTKRYRVHFTDDEDTHLYDEVTINEGGWACCFVHGSVSPDPIKYPPHRIHSVEMEVIE